MKNDDWLKRKRTFEVKIEVFEVKLFEQTCIWGLKWSQWEIFRNAEYDQVQSVRICTILHTSVLFLRYDRFVFRQYVLLIGEERESAVTIIYLVLASDHHMSILFRPHRSMFDWIRRKPMHYLDILLYRRNSKCGELFLNKTVNVVPLVIGNFFLV